MTHRAWWTLTCAALLSVAVASAARAQLCPHVDFDIDGDPTTWRTELPVGVTQGTLDFILETGIVAPTSGWIAFDVSGSYCTDWYFTYTKIGASLAWATFDTAYVDAYFIDAPVCISMGPQCFGTSYIARVHISEAGAQRMQAGHFYVVGSADATGDCSPREPGRCQPAHDMSVTLMPDPSHPDGPMLCAPSTTCTARFVCDTGSPVTPSTWGRIKATYR